MCVNRKPLAYQRFESDDSFRARLIKHPGLSPTERAQVQIACGKWLDDIGDAQRPHWGRRLVWEEQ